MSSTTNQPIIYNVTQTRRMTGIASVQAAMQFAGVKSRTSLLNWERDGKFPARVQVSAQRVGYRWADLYKWADELQAVES